MRTRFKVSHNLRLAKYGDGSILKFNVETKPNQYKEISVSMDFYETKHLISQLTEYLKAVERDNISEIRLLREAFNYSNSQPKITYEEKPKQL